MKKFIEYLDDAKRITGSDYQTAIKLGITKSAVSEWRNKRSTPGTKRCIQLAQILEIDPMEIISAAEVETDNGTKGKRFWTKLWTGARKKMKKGTTGTRYLRERRA